MDAHRSRVNWHCLVKEHGMFFTAFNNIVSDTCTCSGCKSHATVISNRTHTYTDPAGLVPSSRNGSKELLSCVPQKHSLSNVVGNEETYICTTIYSSARLRREWRFCNEAAHRPRSATAEHVQHRGHTQSTAAEMCSRLHGFRNVTHPTFATECTLSTPCFAARPLSITRGSPLDPILAWRPTTWLCTQPALAV